MRSVIAFIKNLKYTTRLSLLGLVLAFSIIVSLLPVSLRLDNMFASLKQTSHFATDNPENNNLLALNKANAIDPATLALLWKIFLNGNDILSGQHDGSEILTGGNSSLNTNSWVKWFGEILLRAILFLVFILIWVFYSLGYGLVMASEWILGIFYNPQFMYSMGGFTTETFVRQAAQQVANFCNMLYIIFLFYIAMKAFFGSSDTYRLLIKLIIAALLTNFALILSGLIIDASQVTMYSIIKEGEKFNPGTNIIDNMESIVMGGASRGEGTTLAEFQESYIEESYDSRPDFWKTTMDFFFDFNKPIKDAIGKVLHIAELMVITFAMVVTIVTITMILLIRIAALWVLLIISPLAVTFSAFPPTEKWWRQWLETFTRYAFTGPILIFFLWLANKASKTIASNEKLTSFIRSQTQNITDQSTFKDDIYIFVVQNFPTTFRFFVLLIIIWAGILIANQFGIKGAKGVDGLIKGTKNWGNFALKGALLPGEILSKTLKGGSWLGYRLSSRRRDNALEKLQSESGALKAELDNTLKGTPAHFEKMQQYESKKTEIGSLEDKIKKSKQAKEVRMQRMAFTSPYFLKKSLSEYIKKLQGEYFIDMDKAIIGYTNYRLNKRKVESLATTGSREALFDYQTQINELIIKWRAMGEKIKEAETEEEKNKLIGERNLLGEKIKFVAEGIGKKTIEDEDTQGKIKETINEKIFESDGKTLKEEVPTDLISETGKTLAIDMFKEAANYARKDSLDFLKGAKIREEEAKKFKEEMEEIKKEGDRFNADFALRQVLRDSVGKIRQKAIIEHLATSSRNFGKLVSGINVEAGNKDNEFDVKAAMEYISKKFSENDAVNILRIAEKDADKTNNITQMGWMTFDSALGKARLTSEPEREELLKRIVSGWNINRKIGKLNSQVIDTYSEGANKGQFKDVQAAKVFVETTDWKYPLDKQKIIDKIAEDLSDKSREFLVKNVDQLSTLAKPQQSESLKEMVNKLRTKEAITTKEGPTIYDQSGRPYTS